MSDSKNAPVNGVWKWSDVVQTLDEGKHPPCWGAVRVDGGPWIGNPGIRKTEDAK